MPRKPLPALPPVLLALALLGGLAVPAARADGYRTDEDLLFEGAPVPDRRARDRRTEEREFRTQLRFQLQLENEEEPGGRGTGLRMRRSRWISTWKPEERLTFQSEVEFDGGDPRILDGFLQLRLKRWSRLWVGQFKSMLSRSFLSSSGGLLFSERSLPVRTFIDTAYQRRATGAFDELLGHGGGRVPRVRITNYWYFGEGERSGDELGIRFRAEVAQGNRAHRIEGETAWTLRLEVHPDGNPSYQEGNLAADRQGRLSFDVAYHEDPGQISFDVDGDGRRDEADRLPRQIANLGFVYRRDRFSSQAEFFRQLQRPRGGLPPIDSRGGYFQVAWTWHPFRWESGLRHGRVDPDHRIAGDTRTETELSLVRYLDENLSKVLVEVVRTRDDANPIHDATTVRLQYQRTF